MARSASKNDENMNEDPIELNDICQNLGLDPVKDFPAPELLECIAKVILEAVEAETAKLRAERDEWHSTALEYARSSDAAHEKLHNMQNAEKFTG